MTQNEDEYEEIYVERLSAEELVEFARYGEPALVSELVTQGLSERLASQDSRGNTMLHMFAANGYLPCVKLFIQHFPSALDVQNAEGNTALHWACVSGQLETVIHLMAAGAKVAVENKAERTPICEAHKHQRTEILKFFEETLGNKEGGESTETTVTEMEPMTVEDQMEQ